MVEQNTFDIRWVISAIIRRWWLIATCLLVATALALFVASRTIPVFEANLTFLVESSKEASAIDYSSLIAGERLALTYSQMLKGYSVLLDVITKLKLSETPEGLANKITASPIKDTQLILLSVEDASPKRAALVANTLADSFISQVKIRETERYADSLASLQEKMAISLSLIEETQSTIVNLNTKKSEVDAELSRQTKILEDDRKNLQSLQQDSQDLQSTINQLMDYVKVIEPAKVPDSLTNPPYFASVTLLVGQDPASENRMAQVNDQLVTTYAEILSGRPVLEAAVEKMGLKDTPDTLAQKIKIEVIPNTQLLRLNVWDSNPAKAELLAGAIAEAFVDQVQALLAKPYSERLANIRGETDSLSKKIDETQAENERLTLDKIQTDTEMQRLDKLLTEYRSDYRSQDKDYSQLRLDAAGQTQTVLIVERAQVPTTPTMNAKIYYSMMAVIVGLVSSFGLIFLLEYQSDVIRTAEDVSKGLGLHTFGSVELVPKLEGGLAVVLQPHSPGAEAFRQLATNLRYAKLDKPLKTLLVTSSSPQEGKSLIVANLAVTLASAGFKVIAVDADLRIPSLHRLFNLNVGKGLTEALVEENIEGKLQPAMAEGLSVLTSGNIPPNPAEVIGSSKMSLILSELEKHAEWVLIDCPPVLPVADATILASMVDGVMMVVRADRTRRREIRDTAERLRKVGGHLVGVVLNAAPGRRHFYYTYYGETHRDGSTGLDLLRKSVRSIVLLFGKNRTNRKINKDEDPEPYRRIKPFEFLAHLFKKRE